ncbi:MAG: ABC transporter permease subunit [Bacteroidales bacterium]|nr:ABC transporter permease subunit [Bacteroidales bacterium]MCB8998644.1 ABC transporter permease subunit [Bacteroidales bacterium]MCB9012488.1 ABC transporter permease subunit [Bacteroidales bacterium]
MIKLLKIELRKTLNYIPFRILIILHFVLFIFGIFFIPRVNFNFPFVTILPLYQFPHVWNFTTWISSFYNISLILLVIMLTCNEFNNKTFKQQLIFGLSRRDLLVQKIILLLLLSLYVIILVGIASITSGLIYSYKITFSLIFDRSWILANLFIQIFTYLCFGLLFSLIFRNMIVSGIVFLAYRVIIEPIIRVNMPESFRPYFPSKFVTKLTPSPDILSMIQSNMQSNGPNGANKPDAAAALFPQGLPMWENLILTFILITVLLSLSMWIFRKRAFN